MLGNVEIRWTNLTGLVGGAVPPARESMGLTAVGNILYLFGGQGPEGQLRGLSFFSWKIINIQCMRIAYRVCLKSINIGVISVQARLLASCLVRAFSTISTKYKPLHGFRVREK